MRYWGRRLSLLSLREPAHLLPLLGCFLGVFAFLNSQPAPRNTWVEVHDALASAVLPLSYAAVMAGYWISAHDANPTASNPANWSTHSPATFLRDRFTALLTVCAFLGIAMIGGLIAISSLWAPWGTPYAPWLIAIVLSPVTCAAIGYGIGVTLGIPLAAPAVGLLWWQLDGMVATASGLQYTLVPRALTERHGMTIWLSNALTPPIAAQLVLPAFTIVATCILLTIQASGPKKHVLGPLVLIIGLLASAGTAMGIANVIKTEAPRSPVELSCHTREGVQICVHPSRVTRIAEVETVAANTLGPIRPALTDPVLITEQNPYLSSPEQVFVIDVSDTSNLEQNVHASLIWDLVSSNSGQRSPQLTESQAVVATWLAIETGLLPPDALDYFYMIAADTSDSQPNAIQRFQTRVDAFSSLEDSHRLRWLRDHLHQLRDGTLPVTALP